MKVMKNDNENLALESRAPKPYEIQQISQILKKETSRDNHICNVIITVLSLGMISFACSLALNLNFIYFLLGLLCLIGDITTIKRKKQLTNIMKLYSAGDFFVCDGYVSKIESTEEIVECKNIMFTSNSGNITLGWYRVREEKLKLKTPLILVYPNPKYKDKRSYVFTDFMLTQHGIKPD